MELQLGLSLQITHTHTKGFDLNTKLVFEGDQDQVITINNNNNGCHNFDMIKKKRSFLEAFDYGGGGGVSSTKTLFPLLSLNGHPNEEEEEDDDDGNGRKKRVNNAIHKYEYDVVGWPPINLWRKKMLHGHQGRRIGRDHDDRTAHDERTRKKSMYVKVNMEGVGIGRKIDLRLFHSYHTLTNTLIAMFSIYKKVDNDGEPYALLYQDNEGDWLLAGDVPWQQFIQTVQRMEILRNAG